MNILAVANDAYLVSMTAREWSHLAGLKCGHDYPVVDCIGASCDVLNRIEKPVAQYEWRERMEPCLPLDEPDSADKAGLLEDPFLGHRLLVKNPSELGFMFVFVVSQGVFDKIAKQQVVVKLNRVFKREHLLFRGHVLLRGEPGNDDLILLYGTVPIESSAVDLEEIPENSQDSA